MSKPVSDTALRSFAIAARLGSLTAAAQSLNVTPTALSHSLKGLEARLGLALLIRTKTGVHPTSAGARLAPVIERAYGEIDRALDSLTAQAHQVRVSTTPAFAGLWLSPRLNPFEDRLPHLRLQIEASYECMDLTRRRDVDLAIRYGPPAETSHLLTLDRFCAFATPALNQQIKTGTPVELLSLQWHSALPHPPPSWDEWSTHAGVRLTIAKERVFKEEQYAFHCAIAGQGVVLASTLLASSFVKQGLLVPVGPELETPALAYNLVVRPDHSDTLKVRQVTRWLQDAMAH